LPAPAGLLAQGVQQATLGLSCITTKVGLLWKGPVRELFIPESVPLRPGLIGVLSAGKRRKAKMLGDNPLKP
jgi:hypothetical protein